MVFFTSRGLTESGVSIGDIDVETEILLNENGTPISHIIVNQGKPGDMYDESCNGTWCLRKDIAEDHVWDSGGSNDYSNSTINAYLNGDWLDRYDANVAEAIVQAKIPYRAGSGYSTTVTSGENGLSVKSFLLSATELNFDVSNMPINEGYSLGYFSDGDLNGKRIAYFNNNAYYWWLRSPYCAVGGGGVYRAMYVNNNGSCVNYMSTFTYGLRPCIILPFNFKLTDDQIVA